MFVPGCFPPSAQEVDTKRPWKLEFRSCFFKVFFVVIFKSDFKIYIYLFLMPTVFLLHVCLQAGRGCQISL